MRNTISPDSIQRTKPKPILIHLPSDLVCQLNDVSSEMGIARAELIRRCLIRDLSFVRDVELRQLEGLRRKSSDQYQKRMIREGHDCLLDLGLITEIDAGVPLLLLQL